MPSVLETPSTERGSGLIAALEGGDFSRAVLREGLLARGELQQEMFALARKRRDEHFPDKEVEARSVVELSNVCQQGCHYCSMAKGSGIKRYVMKYDAVIEMADFLYERGRRVLLFQSGENQAKPWVDSVIRAVTEIKQRHPDFEIILCLGNLTDQQYIDLKKAGGDRYIIKFESSRPDLYHEWKPTDTLEQRLRCIRILAEVGFKVGSGNMVGMPHQTLDDMVDDLRLLGEYTLTMNSCTVFIPGEACGYRDQPQGDIEYAFNTMALMRIMHPDRLMPTTSCLEKLRPGGQYQGLMAGANTITIHDGTPDNFKAMFPIYSTNRFTPDNNHLLTAVQKAGMTISTHPLQ
jgi:biotin synthase